MDRRSELVLTDRAGRPGDLGWLGLLICALSAALMIGLITWLLG